MMLRDDILLQAQQIRQAMDGVCDVLTDEQAATYSNIFLPWEPLTAYAVGDKRRDNGKLWKCLQAHTSQMDWRPEQTPALWVEVAMPGEYRQIKENMLPTEAFSLGEIGWWQEEDNLYKSLINANVYTPISYPAGWEHIE